MEFWKLIKVKRTQKGWGQKELSKETGIGQTTISAYERGKRIPSPENAKAIMKALGIQQCEYSKYVKEVLNSRAIKKEYDRTIGSVDGRIRLAMENKGMRISDLSDALGLSFNATYCYVCGKAQPSIGRLKEIADILEVSPAWLAGYMQSSETTQANVYQIPVIGRVVAGNPLEAIQHIEGYISSIDGKVDNGEYYALRVYGSSMEPEMRDGDIAVVHHQNTFENGDICIVMVGNEDATMKMVTKNEDGITLIGYNVSVYPPHFYSSKEIVSLPITIIGKVVEIRRKL